MQEIQEGRRAPPRKYPEQPRSRPKSHKTNVSRKRPLSLEELMQYYSKGQPEGNNRVRTIITEKSALFNSKETTPAGIDGAN